LRAADTIWLRWKSIAHRVASVQARVLLALVYFTILAPFAAILRVRANPFRTAGWHEHETPGAPESEAARNQF
jgi:hypothetical protein